MRRAPGFTLIELMISVVLLASIATTIGMVEGQADVTRRLGSAYVDDVMGAREALAAVERDLRCATVIEVGEDALTVRRADGDVRFARAGDELTRTDAVGRRDLLALNVAAFSARRNGVLVHVSLQLGTRRTEAARGPTVTTSVRMRAAEGGAK